MDFNKMLQQAQAMQKNLGKMQKELEAKVYEGSASNGLIKAVVSGSFELVSIKLAKEVVDPNEVELLEEMIVLAINDATNKAKEDANKQMKSLTGGMNIPGLF